MENRHNPNGNARKSHQQVKSKSTSALPSTARSRQDQISGKDGYKDSAQYKVYSKSSILADVKNTAASGISNVKQRFSSFSTLLKQHAGKSKNNSSSNYSQIDNMPTPVKLYSPFTIESPPPLKPEEREKLREQLFASPANCLKQDVKGLEYGFNELNMISNQIENSYHYHQINNNNNKNRNISRSIFEDDDNENEQHL